MYECQCLRAVQMALTDLLGKLAATGPGGFEGLIHRLIESLTGYSLHLARSGSQSGRDMRSARTAGAVIAVECKRYGAARELDQTELIGKLTEAKIGTPDLDSWILVASRAVSDQLYTTIERVASELHVEFCIVSTKDGTPSTLEVLCANSPEDVLGFAARLPHVDSEACAQDLSEVRQMEGFGATAARLKADLGRSATYEWWRREGHRWLVDRFGSVSSSRAAFGQVINVAGEAEAGRLVPRMEATVALDGWHDARAPKQRGLVLIGEEGDGKTWTVATWLLNRCRPIGAFPPVIWLGARDVTSREPGTLLSEVLALRFGKDSSYWSGRLAQWLKRATGSQPQCLIVLDGLNERHAHSYWRELLEKLGAKEWLDFAAVLATTRAGHWQYFRRLRDLQITDWTLGPFNAIEFKTALRGSGLVETDIPVGVRDLARKPRYFDLVVTHRKRLIEVGDVTVSRLIYEDWRDRFDRKILPLDDDGFREMLKSLARRGLRHEASISQREVAAALPVFGDHQATLSELATGGILVLASGELKVEPKRLQLGFGLLLAERLQVAAASGDGDRLDEVVAEWLDGLPETEIQAGICESAALHVLSTPGFSVAVRSALLTSWLRARNQQDDIAENVSAYFPLDPDSYFRAAERIWTDDYDDPSAQRVLMSTFVRWSQMEAHRPRFVEAFERWLGFVHVHGSAGVKPEDRQTRQREMVERLGRELLPGSFTFAEFNLTAIGDDGLLRLGRVALAVISGLDRQPFIRALVIGVLAEALHARPEKYDIFSWVIRTAPRSVATDLALNAQRLIETGSRPAMEAAHRLLSFEGGTSSIKLQHSLPDDLFPTSAIWKEFERNPCTSGFAWKREHYARCADSEDVNLFRLAQQVERFAAEETFQMPGRAAQRLMEAGRGFDVTRVHVGPGHTEPDLLLEELEPALCACAPEVAADIYRRLAHQVAVREAHELRLLLDFLNQHCLVFRSAEKEILVRRWTELQKRDSSDDALGGHNEALLVKLLFSWMDGREQLNLLLLRKPADLILTALDRWVRPVSEEQLLAELPGRTERSELQRLLYFAAAQSEPMSREFCQRIAPFVTHSDSWVRASALEILFRSADPTATASIVNGEWCWRRDSRVDENQFGSLLLATYGKALTYEELRARVEPTVFGFAVQSRGLHATEVHQLADDIDRIWHLVIHGVPLPPEDFPKTELRVDDRSPLMGIERVGLAASLFSQTFTSRARNSVWGGETKPISKADFDLAFDGPSDERLDQLQRVMADTLVEQRDAGNIWFGRRFATDGLAAVCAARQDRVAAWLKPVLEGDYAQRSRALMLARSFYESVCDVLLQVNPGLGVSLYTALRDTGALTRTRLGFASLDLIDVSLFSAPQSEQLVEAWQVRFERARSDADLLELSVLCRIGTAFEWLERTIRRDMRSDCPFDIARALTICGFVDAPWASEFLQSAISVGDETWHRALAAEALERQLSDRAAQYQFRRLMDEADADSAWAGFRLLLQVVDRRIAAWHQRESLHPVDSQRVRFLYSNAKTLEKAIEKNEKKLRERFLGAQVRERQVWPWMED